MGRAAERIEDTAMLDYALGEVEAALEILRKARPSSPSERAAAIRATDHLAEAVRVMGGGAWG